MVTSLLGHYTEENTLNTIFTERCEQNVKTNSKNAEYV